MGSRPRRLGLREAEQALGSATSGTWSQETRDVHFLVDLGDDEPGIADRFLDLADDLETLVGRSIDLITGRGLANKPRLEQRIIAHQVELYDAERVRTAA